MTERREEREQARLLLADAKDFNLNEVENNLIQVNEILLSQVAYLMGELSLMSLRVKRMQEILNQHNLGK